MGIPLQTIVQYLEELAPLQCAQSWDKIGLQVGDEQAQINCLLVALEVSEQVITQAINEGAQLIIAHHPLIFTPLNELTWQDPIARLLRRIIQANINLYVAHTNLDSSPHGSSNILADILGFIDCRPLLAHPAKTYKLAVFVPPDYAQAVRHAMGEAGAGVIGDYSHCAFQSEGEGFFQAGETASPFVGERGQLSSVKEVRLETLVSEEILKPVISALKKAHPYEEVAYDLYQVQSTDAKAGLGLAGRLLVPVTLEQLAQRLQAGLNLSGLRWVGDGQQVIERVAVCGGGGADMILDAHKSGAQLYISGDFKYHQVREAQALGLNVIDVGHFACEYLAMQKLAQHLRGYLEKWAVKVITSQQETDPFHYYLPA